MEMETKQPIQKYLQVRKREPNVMWKFFLYSFIGAFIFFVPITINGKNSIILDHIVSYLQQYTAWLIPYYILVIIFAGAIYPVVSGKWKKSTMDFIFTICKCIGFVVGIMLVFKVGPTWLFDPDMGPFLLNKLVIPVGLIVPIGATFLSLLVGYGLLEFIGVLTRPIMRPIWKTPGRSAIDAVASFVGSYSVGLLITNRVYKEGKYNVREASIIATGFSTVSAPFMVIVAKTLGLMDMWNTYFWLTFLVTFIVTAITVRIWPLSQMKEEYYEGATPKPERKVEGNIFSAAWKEATDTVKQSHGLLHHIWLNLKDGLLMTMAILPSILSIGLFGLVIATYTPVFDWIGYIFYPFAAVFHLPDPLLIAKASALSVAEMFLPALLVTNAVIEVKMIIAIVSVSAIIFFSAVVPCIVSTEIPLSIPTLVIIWMERVILTLLIATPLVFLFV